MKKTEDSLHELWDPIKWTNNTGIPEQGEKETESLFKEIITENSQILGVMWTSRYMKLKEPQTRSTQRLP